MKNLFKTQTIIVLVSVLFLLSCGSENEQTDVRNNTTESTKTTQTGESGEDPKIANKFLVPIHLIMEIDDDIKPIGRDSFFSHIMNQDRIKETLHNKVGRTLNKYTICRNQSSVNTVTNTLNLGLNFYYPTADSCSSQHNSDRALRAQGAYRLISAHPDKKPLGQGFKEFTLISSELYYSKPSKKSKIYKFDADQFSSNNPTQIILSKLNNPYTTNKKIRLFLANAGVKTNSNFSITHNNSSISFDTISQSDYNTRNTTDNIDLIPGQTAIIEFTASNFDTYTITSETDGIINSRDIIIVE